MADAPDTAGGQDRRFTLYDIPLLYADDAVAVFNKPSGLAVHRGWDPAPVNAMKLARARLGRHVFPVHRLDRATSGALVFALSHETASVLQDAFKNDQIDKRYLALVRGTPPLEGVIDHPIPRSEKGDRVDAVTHFRRIATVGRFSLVEAAPKTGRLHQIRRHFKHLSHPLVGDVRYGQGPINRLFRADYGLHRLALHALRIQFPHPLSGEVMKLFASVPEDLAHPLEALGIPPFVWAP